MSNSDEILARMKARTQNQYDVVNKIIELLATIETLDSEITQHIKVLEVEASILKAKSAYKIRETAFAEKIFSDSSIKAWDDYAIDYNDQDTLRKLYNEGVQGISMVTESVSGEVERTMYIVDEEILKKSS